MKTGALYGYINPKGENVISPHINNVPFFHNVRNFSEGLASVLIGDKEGFINRAGEIVIEPQFDNALPFLGGLAQVKIGGKYGFINQAGEFVINPQFDRAGLAFSEGLAPVKNRWQVGVYQSGRRVRYQSTI